MMMEFHSWGDLVAFVQEAGLMQTREIKVPEAPMKTRDAYARALAAAASDPHISGFSKIGAIKTYRKLTGVSLVESKDAIERFY